MYPTLSGTYDNGTITFEQKVSFKKARVMVTILSKDDIDRGLYPVPESEVTPELLAEAKKARSMKKSSLRDL
ncbi:MAG TPA: hypothetical protein PKC14_00915 [Candidatus Absconditabacterales bacterium]|nr:hypothetical protein [Candidatus Absconditabacterales bacterium]